MADLDDFFAKKDRKRNKQAKKHSPDDLVKKLEEPRRVDTRPRQEGEDPQQPQTVNQEEDEWREVEVAKKADYTGLKIQHLTGGQENHQNSDGQVGGEQNSNNDQKTKGPWNKTPEAVETKVEEREPPTPSEVVLPPPPPFSKSYVMPALRNRLPGSSLGPPVRNRFSKHIAPDIYSEKYFPTLGGGKQKNSEAGGGGGGTWSEASRGAPPSARPPPREVSLGNRYNSLTNDS